MSIIQSIRDRGALISAIIIGLALLGFILMDAFTGRSNFFQGGNSTTLGVINGKKLDYLEFERKVKAQEDMMKTQGQEVGDAGRQRIIEGMWDQEVNQAIMSDEFEKLGFSVGSKELNDLLYGKNPPQDLKQRFTNEQGIYDDAQARLAMTQMRKSKDPEARRQLEDYLAVVEYNRMTEKYNAIITNSIYFPKWLLEKQNAEGSGLVKISFLRYPYTNIPDSTVKVSDKEIADHIAKRKDQYKQLESRSISFVMFDAAPTAADSAFNKSQLEALKTEFASSTDPSAFLTRYGSGTQFDDRYIKEVTSSFADSVKRLPDGGVFGAYLDGTNYTLSKMIGRKSVPDSTKVRHILIKVADRQNGQVREDSVAKKLADSIQAAVAGGADFNALVLKYSDDEGSKNNKGEYTFSPNQSLVKEFYETSFYEPAGTKKVVKGESGDYVGYHYLEVMSQQSFGPGYKIAHLSKPIYPSDETERKANNDANSFAGESRDAKSFDANFEKNLKSKGIIKMFAANIKPNDYYVSGLNAPSRPLVRKIYDAKKGEVLQPELVGDKYIVATVTEVLEEGTQSAAIARGTVEPVLRNKKKAEMIKKKLGNISTLEAVATSNNLQIEIADSVRFLGMTPGIGPEPKIIGAAFNPANTGKVIPEAIEGQSGVFILRVDNLSATSVIAGDIQEQRRMMESQAKQRAIGYSEYGGQQSPPYLQTLKKVSKIKDKRSDFY